MDRIYKSKVGLEFVLPLIFIFILLESLVIWQKAWPVSLLLVGFFIFVAFIFSKVNYAITDGGVLIVKAGIFGSLHVEASRIKSVKPTNSIWSAPALSMDRLRIVYDGHSEVVISPKDKEGFVAELKKWNPEIIVME